MQSSSAPAVVRAAPSSASRTHAEFSTTDMPSTADNACPTLPDGMATTWQYVHLPNGKLVGPLSLDHNTSRVCLISNVLEALGCSSAQGFDFYIGDVLLAPDCTLASYNPRPSDILRAVPRTADGDRKRRRGSVVNIGTDQRTLRPCISQEPTQSDATDILPSPMKSTDATGSTAAAMPLLSPVALSDDVLSGESLEDSSSVEDLGADDESVGSDEQDFYRADTVAVSFVGHTGDIYGVNFSPDGLVAATGSADGTFRMWDAQTGACVGVVQDPGQYVFRSVFSNDGALIATCSRTHEVRLYNTATRELVQTCVGHSALVYSAAFDHAGKRLITSSGDSTMRVWSIDGAMGECLGVLRGFEGHVFGVSVSPDNSLVVGACTDRTVRVFDLNTYQQVVSIEHSSVCYGASFSRDGKYLATCSSDPTIRLYHPKTFELLHELSGHTAAVYFIMFSPNSRLLASVSEDRRLILWDMRTMQPTSVFSEHVRQIFACAFSPDGRRIASAGADHICCVSDIPLEYVDDESTDDETPSIHETDWRAAYRTAQERVFGVRHSL